MNRVIFILNYPPLYRKGLFEALEKELEAQWFFSNAQSSIKSYDISKLGNASYLKSKSIAKRLAWQKKLVNIFKRADCPIIATGSINDLSLWAILILRTVVYRKKKIYLWTHGWYGNESRLKRVIKTIFFNMASGLLLYGDRAKSLMVANGFDSKRLFVVHNSLDYSVQRAIRQTAVASPIFNEHFKNNYPNIIFIGRLTKVKNIDMLLYALSELKNAGESYNLILVGSGEQESELKNLSKKLGIDDNVWFYGSCFDEKTNGQLLYNADLCVSPGNVGLTAIHSLTYGTPVISHGDFTKQMPEYEAIKRDLTGDFFKYKDVHSLSLCIQKWFRIHGNRRTETRQAANKEIDENWTPLFQVMQIKKALGYA